MHNLTKIKIFRCILWITYPVALVLIYPLVAFRLRKKSSLFFFLDRYAIGGAQHVYLDILESVSDKHKTVYFTRKSPNDKLKSRFYNLPNTDCIDIHIWCDFLLLRIFSVHYFAFYVNKHRNATVLSSNSTFFYDMLPFLKKEVKKIELLHNFSYGKKGMEFFGLANHEYLDYRMVIDEITKQNIIIQYRNHKVENRFAERVIVCEYGVNIPPPTVKPPSPPLKVLYAGRGTKQKRVWLLNRVAEHYLNSKQAVTFSFAGPLQEELSDLVKSNCNVLGEVGDPSKMNDLFAEHHVIILTSAFEGFPVVVKQGMSYGCVPIVTALPSNKLHLIHLENSLLIDDYENEERVVKECIRYIDILIAEPSLLHKLAHNAYTYAREHFGKVAFVEMYRKLLS